MKYVVLAFTTDTSETDVTSFELPIMFPDAVVHASMSYLGEYIARHHGWIFDGPVSAGFIEVASMKCHGESESLALKSRPEKDRSLFNTVGHTGGFL